MQLKGGRNNVLSRREQVGPSLIHGGPTRARSEACPWNPRQVPKLVPVLSPFNFGQTRLRGFVKLPPETSNRGVGKQAEKDHVGTLCRFSGWAPGTATGPSAMRGPFQTPYTSTVLELTGKRIEAKPGHDPSAIQDHPTARHRVTRSRGSGCAQENRHGSFASKSFCPVVHCHDACAPGRGLSASFRWCHGDGVIGSSRSQEPARPMFLSRPIPPTVFDSCRCARPQTGAASDWVPHRSRGSTPDGRSSQLQSCALQTKLRGCRNWVGMLPDSAHQLTEQCLTVTHAGVINYRPLGD
jgi:hypothetical protein